MAAWAEKRPQSIKCGIISFTDLLDEGKPTQEKNGQDAAVMISLNQLPPFTE